VFCRLKHPNIVSYYTSWKEENPPPEWEYAAEVKSLMNFFVLLASLINVLYY
jgi:hypothetical protein